MKTRHIFTKILFSTFLLLISSSISAQFTTTDIAGGIVITGYSGTIPSNLVIPETIDGKTVLGISGSAFSSKQLTSVRLPTSLISIGSYAFSNNKLTNIAIPDGVTSIGANAFSNNNNLCTYTYNGCLTLNLAMFFGCPIGQCDEHEFKYKVNDDLSVDYTRIIGYKGSNRDVTIPDGVTSIGGFAFSNDQLTSIVIPDGVTSIENYAFGYNDNLCTYTYNGSLKLTPAMFFNCPIGQCEEHEFIYALNDDLTVDYTTIVNYKGSNRDITIPDGVTSIGSSAFYSNQLTSVRLPASLTSIGILAFSDNELTNVAIPDGVTSIGANAFSNNNNLCTYTYNGSLTLTLDMFLNCPIGQCEEHEFIYEVNYDLSVDYTSVVDYKGSDRDITIPDGVISIGAGAFWRNQLKSIVIPDGVTSIGQSAFGYNPLTCITFNKTSYFIGRRLPEVLGYELLGWYDNPDFTGEQMTHIPEGSSGSVTYWAKKEIINYNISYVNVQAGEAVTNPSTYTIESEDITLDQPLARIGYVFTGWYADEQLTSPVTSPAIKSGTVGNRIFYARWEVGTSIDQSTNNKSKIFPNPTRGIVHINSDYEQLSIEVYDISGRLMNKQIVSGVSTIDWSTVCKKGLYIIKTMDLVSGENSTTKLVVE